MLELLIFEYYRILKSKYIWVLAGLCAIMPILAAVAIQLILGELGEDIIDQLKTSNVRFLTWYVIAYFYERVPLLLGLFVPLFIGRDYKDGFIRNKLTAGHKRIEIFASAIITEVTVAVALSIIYIVFGLASIACTSVGCDVNKGEMFGRAFTLLLSLIATTTLFAVISLLIKSRAGTVVICIAFVFSFGMFKLLASNYSYTHEMVDEYEELYDEVAERYSGGSPTTDIYFSIPEFNRDLYFNSGWYIGHPLFVVTNAALGSEFIPTLQSMIMSTDAFEYPDKIDRLGMVDSVLSAFTGNYGQYLIDQRDLEDIPGAFVKYREAEVIYNLKSVVWIGIYFGAGYALFRKKNIF